LLMMVANIALSVELALVVGVAGPLIATVVTQLLTVLAPSLRRTSGVLSTVGRPPPLVPAAALLPRPELPA
jgi:hypothetical protein